MSAYFARNDEHGYWAQSTIPCSKCGLGVESDQFRLDFWLHRICPWKFHKEVTTVCSPDLSVMQKSDR